MPIENIVAAAELSATTDPVGNCMGASPRAACATPDHYPVTAGKKHNGGRWMATLDPASEPTSASTERHPILPGGCTCGVGIRGGADDCGDAASMIVVTD
ncbi:hypothetical protein [Burkholderia contaminans]|uniref:hypothetical protein n=1 Tax=Burkholderia contaminans TaxID=488447 RepID=UPI00162814B6|nr:hypothetical protein [Burkholderia contaminans]